jgi:hypothetical protein
MPVCMDHVVWSENTRERPAHHGVFKKIVGASDHRKKIVSWVSIRRIDRVELINERLVKFGRGLIPQQKNAVDNKLPDLVI